jgi:hypothetical protein
LIALLLPSGASQVVVQLHNYRQVAVTTAFATRRQWLCLEVYSIFTALGVGIEPGNFSNLDSS